MQVPSHPPLRLRTPKRAKVKAGRSGEELGGAGRIGEAEGRQHRAKPGEKPANQSASLPGRSQQQSRECHTSTTDTKGAETELYPRRVAIFTDDEQRV